MLGNWIEETRLKEKKTKQQVYLKKFLSIVVSEFSLLNVSIFIIKNIYKYQWHCYNQQRNDFISYDTTFLCVNKLLEWILK